MKTKDIFVTGATGLMGRHLVPLLLRRGHKVRAVVREGSESTLPPGCEPVIADALDSATYVEQIPPSATFVQLVGVSHPSLAKANQFREIDLKSALEAVNAAKAAGASHFVYVSVAQPAPVMNEDQIRWLACVGPVAQRLEQRTHNTDGAFAAC